jgi:N-acetylmuramoyl-L-alanine amidase
MKLATDIRTFVSADGVKVEVFDRGVLLESYLIALPFAPPLGVPIGSKPPTLPIPQVKDIWTGLVTSVRLSSMTDSMKAACIAQAINESSRGTSKVAHTCLNFWGMKMRPELTDLAFGVEVEVTSEVEGKATFASFISTDFAVKGWLKFLSRVYYQGWELFKDDSEGFLRHIGKYWCPKEGYADELIANLPEARKLLGLAAPAKSTKRLLLDPGHSKQEPGAQSNDGTAHEEELALLMCELISDELDQHGHSADIFDPQVDDIAAIGKKAKGYDGFISNHLNSYKGNADPGAEVFVVVGAPDHVKDAARRVLDLICKRTGAINRGVKEKNWTVIFEASKVCSGPVMLIESFFLNPYNAKEARAKAVVAADAISEALVQILAEM